MKLQYWGTAAAEGIPAIFCRCEICKKARERGGRNLRGRSNALIDGVLKIDFNADTYGQSLKYGVDLTDIHHLLVTHTHQDHWYPADISMRRRGFGNFCGEDASFHVYGSEKVQETVDRWQNDKGFEDRISGILVKPMEKVQIDKYTVYPVRGIHDPGAGPLIYAITDGEKTLLYWHDSGPLPDEAFAYWKENGLKFNFVSMDCTSACSSMNYDAHMNLERNIAMRARLLEEGLADGKTIFCCNHFSHNGAHSLYDEFAEIAAKEGFITSYDGMTVEI